MRKGTRGFKALAARTMDSDQRLTQVISAMRSEIRKLELENMGLKRRAGAKLRKNATVPIIITGCRGRLTNLLLESVVMTVRRYAVFQPLVSHQTQMNNVKGHSRTGK